LAGIRVFGNRRSYRRADFKTVFQMSIIIPALLFGAAAIALLKKTDVFAALTAGAKDGLSVILGIFPALVGILTAARMFRASGAMDALTALIAPVLSFVGIPAETAPLMLVRPLSGSGAMAAASEIITRYGADSFVGRCAAVMLGSTETTFYVIAVYFGAAGIKRSRHTVPSALIADAVGFLAAALFSRLFFPG